MIKTMGFKWQQKTKNKKKKSLRELKNKKRRDLLSLFKQCCGAAASNF
jgi:hypothetical protein